MPPTTRARVAAEALAHAAAPATKALRSLLVTLAHAPAAAALVIAALGAEDRKALRLVCTHLRDAVGEATTKLEEVIIGATAARPPTPRSWPCLEELTVRPGWAAPEALGTESWSRLHTLCIGRPRSASEDQVPGKARLDVSSARSLAAALQRMPALRRLELQEMDLSGEAAEELFRASSTEGVPLLRSLTLFYAPLSPAAARLLAATGWQLEKLDLNYSPNLGAAGLAELLAAPTFAIRRLALKDCGLDAAAVLSLANAPWPLEELHLPHNNLSAAAAGPALAALSRHAGLHSLGVGFCDLSAAGFKTLVEVVWPALTSLDAGRSKVKFTGPHALGAGAFAGFPVLEKLQLYSVRLGWAGAALLASRRWPRLKTLGLLGAIGDAGLAALAHGAWPALEVLDLRHNKLSAPPTLEDVRRWTPALVELLE